MARASTLRQRLSHTKPLRRFFRGRAPLYPPIVLNRHCIYILPTSAGLGFGFMILVMLIGAMNYQNNLAYLLSFTLIGLSLTTMIETYRQLLHLTISIGHIEPVFSGQTLTVPIIIKFNGQRRFAIEMDKQAISTNHDIVPPQDTINFALPATKRGLHQLGLLRISSRFPLGLFRAWTPLPLGVDYLVYPEVEAHPPSAQLQSSRHTPTGVTRNGEEDFAGIKSYHPGDSPRHIHWKAYAKGQGLQSKKFSNSHQLQRWFDWDDTQGLPFEQRLSRLSAWLLDAERNTEHFGLRMPHTVIELGHGRQHLHRCLKVLALYQQEQLDA